MSPRPWFACLLSSVAVLGAAPCAAVTVDGSLDVVSDYRFRGVSLSDRQPVAEGTVDLQAGSWFAGAEVITASRARSPYQMTRANAELDVSTGWTRAVGLLTPAAGVIVYLRPGGGEPAIAEGFASLAGALGPATVTAGANYAPAQAAARGGNLYLFTKASVAIPATPLTLHAAVGRERGALDGGATKVDYAGGIEARVVRFITLGVDYIGNDLPTAGPGRVVRNRENGFVVRAGVRF